MAAGAALAAKRGRKSKSSLGGASRSMYKSMSRKELRKVAKTKRKKLPTRNGNANKRHGTKATCGEKNCSGWKMPAR